MEVVLFHEHGDQFVAQDKGYNHPSYRDHHVIAQIVYHGENPGVPCRRGRPHVCRNFPDFAVDLVKHPVQVAHNAVPEDALDPVCDYVEDVQHWLRPLSRTGSPAGG